MSGCASSALLSAAASTSSCVALPFCSTSVSPPGSTSMSVGPLDSTLGSLGGSSGLRGQRCSLPSSPGSSSTALDALDTLISTHSWLLHPLAPSGLLGGSVGASGRCLSSPITSAGSSDGLCGFVVLASSPEWPHNTLHALMLVVMLGWWRCVPGPLQAPGLAALGRSRGSASPPLPSCAPLHRLCGPRRCPRMLSPAPAFASCHGAAFVLLWWGSMCNALGAFVFCWSSLVPSGVA